MQNDRSAELLRRRVQGRWPEAEETAHQTGRVEKGLIANWDGYCHTAIPDKAAIALEYVNAFPFGIFKMKSRLVYRSASDRMSMGTISRWRRTGLRDRGIDFRGASKLVKAARFFRTFYSATNIDDIDWCRLVYSKGSPK